MGSVWCALCMKFNDQYFPFPRKLWFKQKQVHQQIILKQCINSRIKGIYKMLSLSFVPIYYLSQSTDSVCVCVCVCVCGGEVTLMTKQRTSYHPAFCSVQSCLALCWLARGHLQRQRRWQACIVKPDQPWQWLIAVQSWEERTGSATHPGMLEEAHRCFSQRRRATVTQLPWLCPLSPHRLRCVAKSKAFKKKIGGSFASTWKEKLPKSNQFSQRCSSEQAY